MPPPQRNSFSKCSHTNFLQCVLCLIIELNVSQMKEHIQASISGGWRRLSPVFRGKAPTPLNYVGVRTSLCSWHLPGATHPSRPCTCATSCCMVRKEGGVGAHHGGDHGGALQLQLLKGRDWALRAVSADGSRQARRLVTFVERGHTKAITCCLPK